MELHLPEEKRFQNHPEPGWAQVGLPASKPQRQRPARCGKAAAAAGALGVKQGGVVKAVAAR